MSRMGFGLALAAIIGVLPLNAATIFTDSTFSLGSYSQLTYNSDPGDVTIAVTQTLSGGNPGAAAEIMNTWSTPNILFNTAVGLLNTSFTYNPSTQGAIQNVGLSLDRYVTLVGGTLGGTNNGTVLLSQGGSYYFATVTGPSLVAGTFQTITGTVTQNDFQLFDFATGTTNAALHPDFSSAGGIIDFGLRTRFDHTNMVDSGGTLDIRLDNLSLTLTPTPEPGAYGLVGAGLAALWFVRQRRARP